MRPASQAVSDLAVGTWHDEKLTPKFMLHLRYAPTPLGLMGFRVCENFRDSFWFLAKLAESVIDSVFRAKYWRGRDKDSQVSSDTMAGFSCLKKFPINHQ